MGEVKSRNARHDHNLARYLETLLRYRLRFMVLLVVAPLTLGTSTALLFRTYDAAAGLWIDSPSYLGQTVAPADWSPRLEPAANATATLSQLLSTNQFAGAVADKLHSSGLLSDLSARAALAASLGSGVRVRPRGSHLVDVSYSTSRPEQAVAVVRAVVALYLDHEAAAQQAQLDVSTTFLTTKVTSGESASAGSQLALNQYLSSHPGLRAPAAGTSSGIAELDRLAQQLDQNQAELAQLRAELAQARFLGEAARRVVETNTRLIDEPRITGSGPLGDGSSLIPAAILALVCWVGSALYMLVLVWADQTARDPKDLERRLGVPVLTTIPLIGLQERF
jgi:uncharacterized protein involved in exopolysaccharide biosynthesis